jgi:hypothetical protein
MITVGLWLTVILSGIYHGANPAMGWPLAVSAGLMGRGQRDLIGALGPLAFGHLLAMAGILLPFALMAGLVEWQREIRIGAALTVVAFGLWLLVHPRHPRFIARIKPTQLTLWSFAVAMAHGAGLMLVPIYLGLCRARNLDHGHQALAALMGGNLETAIAASIVHAAAMVLTGGLIASLVYGWLGLRFLARSWFNLERVWASSLVAVGGLALALAWLDVS